ncbi:hypothetical protein [Streptomyces sp. NPDC045251]|uniref:hypothetical protein n=1 Tax=unclassified Streptomyces TaxID=2593676 RepID=UPI0033F1324C
MPSRSATSAMVVPGSVRQRTISPRSSSWRRLSRHRAPVNTSAGRCRASTTSAREAAPRTTRLSRRTFSGHSYEVRARTAAGANVTS